MDPISTFTNSANKVIQQAQANRPGILSKIANITWKLTIIGAIYDFVYPKVSEFDVLEKTIVAELKRLVGARSGGSGDDLTLLRARLREEDIQLTGSIESGNTALYEQLQMVADIYGFNVLPEGQDLVSSEALVRLADVAIAYLSKKQGRWDVVSDENKRLNEMVELLKQTRNTLNNDLNKLNNTREVDILIGRYEILKARKDIEKLAKNALRAKRSLDKASTSALKEIKSIWGHAMKKRLEASSVEEAYRKMADKVSAKENNTTVIWNNIVDLYTQLQEENHDLKSHIILHKKVSKFVLDFENPKALDQLRSILKFYKKAEIESPAIDQLNAILATTKHYFKKEAKMKEAEEQIAQVYNAFQESQNHFEEAKARFDRAYALIQ